MVYKTLNRVYSSAKDETNPFYDKHLAHSLETILHYFTPTSRSIEELEEIFISRSSGTRDARKLLKQLREASEETWSKLAIFETLLDYHANGISLTLLKEKRESLARRKAELEDKIKNNEELILKAEQDNSLISKQ